MGAKVDASVEEEGEAPVMLSDGHVLLSVDDHKNSHHHLQHQPVLGHPAMQAPEDGDASAAARFVESLSELKDLRSQLRHAADHCESAFLESTENKKLLLESTKEYICHAVVTAVDHLGSVSANLDALLHQGAAGASGTAHRLECIAQRVLTWRECAVAVGISRVRWSPGFERYAPRYVSRWPFRQAADGYHVDNPWTLNYKVTDGGTQDTRLESLMALEDSTDKHQGRRLFRTSSVADAGPDFSAMLPVSGGHSILADPVCPSFSSQTESVYAFTSDSKEKKKKMKRKLVKNMYLMALVRSKRYSL